MCMFYNVEEACNKNIILTINMKNETDIHTQMIYMCAWVTFMDMSVGMLMDVRVLVRKVLQEQCC